MSWRAAHLWRARAAVHLQFTGVHMHVCVHARGEVLVRFLSCLAQFALFVFNDASREADSRRVERAAFDVSDYDITDVQPRRAEEWGSARSLFSFSVFFFFFSSLIHSHPSGTLFREIKDGKDGWRD